MNVRIKTIMGDTMNEKEEENYLDECFNFSCVLRGHVKDLEAIKEYIIKTYVDKGSVKMIKPTYEKKRLYIMTEQEWEDYQNLKSGT
jgi:hypothetical protein